MRRCDAGMRTNPRDGMGLPFTEIVSICTTGGCASRSARPGRTIDKPAFKENQTFPCGSFTTERSRFTPSVPSSPSARPYSRRSLSSSRPRKSASRLILNTRLPVAIHKHSCWSSASPMIGPRKASNPAAAPEMRPDLKNARPPEVPIHRTPVESRTRELTSSAGKPSWLV